MPQHRAISPDECPPCRHLFSVLEEHAVADPAGEVWLTTEEIGRLVGLKKRATQVHLAHLFAHARIDADRRTPLPGSTVGQPLHPGAQAWANTVASPDPACSKFLVTLARWGWSGQVGMMELAKAAGTSLRSVERHRPHLVAANLVAFRPVTVKNGANGHRLRRPDRFTLLSQIPARPLSGAELENVPAAAARICERVSFLAKAPAEERELAQASVSWCLRNGWPEAALLRALDVAEDRTAYRPSSYLATLLRRLPCRYIVPAQNLYTGRTAPWVTECAVCSDAVRTTLPRELRILCGGAICRRSAEKRTA